MRRSFFGCWGGWKRKNTNKIQTKIGEDLRKLEYMEKVLVKSDKTNNWYLMEPEEFKKQLRIFMTKDYKLTEEGQVERINLKTARKAKEWGNEESI